ncbi:hypothetical protein ACFSKY_16050 [Azotobacter chroococcum]|jgi:hypothetical protein|uniref:Adhesin n=1 Tax=Azotobacter chroococcum TaxID=353 RepID=A0A4R1P6J3_9GAMM|nr:hypothetical protein [Azotobacter chroococcum]TBV95672.1 hypothetical protein E0E53_12645 [Azotobacter chroococcum]TCL22431.1 hypothetical protein EV691_13230 [Azotobacter chroococcum]
MKSLSPIFAVLLALSAGLAFADAQAGERRVVRTNGQGGGSATQLERHAGPRGSLQRGRVMVADGQGNASAARGASRSRSDDGSRQSERSLSATGSQGSSLQSNASLTYTAESGLSQSRSTSLTNAATGNSVQGSTSYSRDGGLTRSVACQDASGASIACPSR